MAPDIKQTSCSFGLLSGPSGAVSDQIAAGSRYSLIETDAEVMSEGAEVTAVRNLVIRIREQIDVEGFEFETQTWVARFNDRRLIESIGNRAWRTSPNTSFGTLTHIGPTIRLSRGRSLGGASP